MKILVITQTVDIENTTLGFFHSWLKEISKDFDSVHVICLSEGKHDLGKNVFVHTLGKDQGISKISYVLKFYYFIWKYRFEYDKVFVHMNQEYILLGGIFWKILKKDIFFWRNHPYGNIWTRIAIFFSKKVFCTSSRSFTAKYENAVLMPVGIDTNLFKPVSGVQRNKSSICMVGRISPIKKIDLGLSLMKYLINSGMQVSLTIVGIVLPRDQEYYLSLVSFVKKNKLGSFIKFVKAVPQNLLPEIYSSHQIILNLTEDGSFDKTIVEAVACGAIPLVANVSLSSFLPDVCITQSDVESIAESIRPLFQYDTKVKIEKDLAVFADKNSLDNLMKKLTQEISLFLI